MPKRSYRSTGSARSTLPTSTRTTTHARRRIDRPQHEGAWRSLPCTLAAKQQRADHQRQLPRQHPSENRATYEHEGKKADRHSGEPHGHRHGREHAGRKDRELGDHAGEDCGRNRPHPHDDLGILVEPACECDAEPAPHLARQEADEDERQIGTKLARRRAHRSASRKRCTRYAAVPPTMPLHIRSSPICHHANTGPSTSPNASESRSTSMRLLRKVDIRKATGVRNSSAAVISGGSLAAR